MNRLFFQVLYYGDRTFFVLVWVFLHNKQKKKKISRNENSEIIHSSDLDHGSDGGIPDLK